MLLLCHFLTSSRGALHKNVLPTGTSRCFLLVPVDQSGNPKTFVLRSHLEAAGRKDRVHKDVSQKCASFHVQWGGEGFQLQSTLVIPICSKGSAKFWLISVRDF